MTYPLLVQEAEPWYAIPWQDWLGVVGLPLAFLGLWLTWKQASGAKNAAEATRTAVRRTQTQLRANQLLVLIPQLRWIASELDAAIDEDNQRLARRNLDSWRWQANNIHGMLSAADPAQRKILRALQLSVGQAQSAGAALMGKGTISVLRECSKSRESIAIVCDSLSAWVGENISKVSEDEE